ncbi:DNA mismatch repair protein MutS [Fulvivirgaceae bacterium BMA10]|uniref:DNA mismatch repair protein MutS n=1 Tax=Splendidivirga corallicola TaxID=3051826 RepID=A0ABT8KP87_9BACT|nr:DNA mismatch repair protein MutS [Fulvivirgaceae bacterium BMA10]
MEPREIFQKRINEFKEVAEALKIQSNRFSIIRIVCFLLSIVLLVYFANAGNLGALLAVVLIFPFLFGTIVKYHNRLIYRRNHHVFLQTINQSESVRQEGNLKPFDQGEEFLDIQHPYVADLDVFGKNSLFQLLNRTTTGSGRALLADWLKTHSGKTEIEKRQEAVKELSKNIDWRQDLQARGMHFQDEESHIHTLLEWIEEPDRLTAKTMYWFLQIIMPVITIALIILYFSYGISGYIPFAAIVVNSLILKKVFEIATETTEKTSASIKALKAYNSLIGKIENTTFESEKLQLLQANFSHDDFLASHEIKKLQVILDNLETRANILYWFFNAVFLLDLYWLLRAEHWKRKTKVDVSHWFDAISEFEVLNSLAGFSFANRDFCFPIMRDESYSLSAKHIGHPLIKSKQRISNNFSMKGKGKVIVITGSNMSGKSTFLRTIGVNTVLAQIGAPVCAEEMEVGVIQVFTSMRTQDDLEESVSSFYAELKRLRQLLDLLEKDEPVLFMLDEILKGTNSKDRHNGAISLIKQLSTLNASGFVSTHDLELGNLAKESDFVENYSFNSQIIGDEIIFDYKLHDGICKSFNASKLMERIGIKMNSN